jgi:hypothetical protein
MLSRSKLGNSELPTLELLQRGPFTDQPRPAMLVKRGAHSLAIHLEMSDQRLSFSIFMATSLLASP